MDLIGLKIPKTGLITAEPPYYAQVLEYLPRAWTEPYFVLEIHPRKSTPLGDHTDWSLNAVCGTEANKQ